MPNIEIPSASSRLAIVDLATGQTLLGQITGSAYPGETKVIHVHSGDDTTILRTLDPSGANAQTLGSLLSGEVATFVCGGPPDFDIDITGATASAEVTIFG